MDQTPSVIPPPDAGTTLELRDRSRTVRRTIVFFLLGVLVLAVLGVYALDPWGWRTKDRGPGPTYHWEEAQKAIKERDFDEGRKHLQEYLKIVPFNAEACFLLARTCRREQDFRSWRKQLFHASQLQWPQEQIDLEFRLQQAQIGDVWSVEQTLLQDLKAKSGEDAELILEALAEGYLKNRSVAHIIQLTGPWMEQFPDDWLPHFYRATIQYAEGSRRQAIEEYRTVLKLNPDHGLAQLLLAGALMDDGQFKEALHLYETYLKENSGDPTALYGVANCHFSLGESDETRKTLRDLLVASPSDVRALYLQAKVALTDDRPAEALTWLRKAERLAPQEPEITHMFIVVLQRLNRPEQAEKYVQIQEIILGRQEQLGKLRKQLRREPGNVELRFQLGRINMLLGRDNEAEAWFHMVLHLDANHVETRNALKELEERNGRPLEASDNKSQLGKP
jgi:predicted Zn-dependent protease